jgi:iron complex transport system substrate-binding protein
VRIVSLLPAATETLFALGLGSAVVGVTHECDHPDAGRALPRVTRPTLELGGLDGGEVEARVAEAAGAGRLLYEIDAAAILKLRPDVVVAQDVCGVCAVPADQALAQLTGVPIIRQHPHTLDEVLDGIQELGAACGADATALVRSLRERIAAAAATAAGRPLVRGVFLEWLDPPYPAGHWTPDLLRLAGVEDPLAQPGRPSRAIGWKDVAAAEPQMLILAPCGFDLPRARAEVVRQADQLAALGAGPVLVFDGSSFFNRPGPRLVESLEVLTAGVASIMPPFERRNTGWRDG